MKDKTALIAAFAELDFEQTTEEMLMVVNVLDATEKAWLSLTEAQYDQIVWGEERKANKRIELEEMDE
jgi:predicted lipid carrier protein YhbT